MRSHDLLASLKPLPYLPLELKHHILRFCDPSTLARTSRISLAFLQLSSPLLYRDIELIGLERAEKLFCTRPKHLSQPQLHPYLSLHYVKTLTVVATFQTGGHLYLSTDKLHPPPSSWFKTLPVDFLTLRPIAINPCDIDDQEEEVFRWHGILSLLDPNILLVHGLPNSTFNPGQIPRLDLCEYVGWANLTSVVLANVCFEGSLGAWLDDPRLEKKQLSVSFDLSECWRWGDEGYRSRLRRDGVVDEIASLFFASSLPSLRRVVIRTGSLDQKEMLEGEVKQALSFIYKDDDLRKVLESIQVEVVEAAQKS